MQNTEKFIGLYRNYMQVLSEMLQKLQFQQAILAI